MPVVEKIQNAAINVIEDVDLNFGGAQIIESDPISGIIEKIPPVKTLVDQIPSIGNFKISDFGSLPDKAAAVFENAGNIVNNIPGVSAVSSLLSGITEPGKAMFNNVTGFMDNTGKYPKEFRKLESDWHRLTGREPDEIRPIMIDSQAAVEPQPQDTYKESHVQKRNDARVGEYTKPPTSAGTTWDEPESDKKTIYGQSYIINTPGGVFLEMDSTPNSTAFRVGHPTNSFMEINNAGEFIQKTWASRYDSIAKDHRTYINKERWTSIRGNDDLCIQGTQFITIYKDKKEIDLSDSKLMIMGDYTRQIAGNDKSIIGKDQKVTIGQDHELMVAMSYKIGVGMFYTLKVGLDAEIDIGVTRRTIVGVMDSLEVGAAYDCTVGVSHSTTVGALYSVKAGANIDFKTATFTVKAGVIMLN